MGKTARYCFANRRPLVPRKDRLQGITILAIFLACNLTPASGQDAGIRPQVQPVASLADSLKRVDSTNTQLHILYVHGMADDGPGYSDSEVLRRSICKFLRNCTSAEGQSDGRQYADKDKFAVDATPPGLSYLGEQVWKSRAGGSLSEGWNASAPFVDHWKLARIGAPAIYVDEINWWPLVFAVKCRQIIAKDAALVGPSKAFIDKCSSFNPDLRNPGRFLSYSWIEDADAQRLKAMPARGALINRSLKSYVLDWGFADAVLAVGQMQPYLLEGIRQLILKSIHVDADGSRGEAVEPSPNQEFVIVSHSLGSFLVFSALDIDLTESNTPKMQEWKRRFEKVLAQTSIVYFFANQLRLLELANLDNNAGANMIGHLETWGQLRGRYQDSSGSSTRNDSRPRLVAWSDPSDLLSWNVPELQSVLVKNQYVKNSPHWLWLFEIPTSAHGNYDKNKHVIRVMLKASETR
jgi:hypothetical protein